SNRTSTPLRLALSGAFMGLGIVAMHYTGMAAMNGHADLRYDRLYVALSVFIAIGAATAALCLAFRTTDLLQKLGAAVVMGSAFRGWPSRARGGEIFPPNGRVLRVGASLDQPNLALAVAAITFMILACALVASLFDRRFAVLAEREAQLLRESEERFRLLYRD